MLQVNLWIQDIRDTRDKNIEVSDAVLSLLVG